MSEGQLTFAAICSGSSLGTGIELSRCCFSGRPARRKSLGRTGAANCMGGSGGIDGVLAGSVGEIGFKGL